MDNKQFVTDAIMETIDSNQGLYDSMQRKFRLGVFRQLATIPNSYLADVTIDAKQTAKQQSPSLDLRNFSPVLMEQHYKTEYAIFKKHQTDMATDLQDCVGCFLTKPFIDFLQGKRTLLISELIDATLITIVLLDDLTQLRPTTQKMSTLLSLRIFCASWSRWAIWTNVKNV